MKDKAREQAKAVRQKIHGGASPSVYTGLSQHLLALLDNIGVTKSQVVAGFWPHGSEIDCRVALSDISRRGHILSLPAIERENQPLVFRQFEMGDELVAGAYGIKEPSNKAPHVTPDIILLPLLAFDKAGDRLGYGGGYYDRTVAALRQSKELIIIGIAFSGQLVRQVPRHDHDIRLDYILTEQGVLGGAKAELIN